MKIKVFAAFVGIINAAICAALFRWLGVKAVVIGSMAFSLIFWVILIIFFKKAGIEITFRSVHKMSINSFGGAYSLAAMILSCMYLCYAGHTDYALGLGAMMVFGQILALVTPTPKGILD